MKYLILNPVNKKIMHISSSISYLKNGACVLDTNIRISPNIFEVATIEEIPEEVIPEKYLYINNQFVINKLYKEKEEQVIYNDGYLKPEELTEE